MLNLETTRHSWRTFLSSGILPQSWDPLVLLGTSPPALRHLSLLGNIISVLRYFSVDFGTALPSYKSTHSGLPSDCDGLSSIGCREAGKWSALTKKSKPSWDIAGERETVGVWTMSVGKESMSVGGTQEKARGGNGEGTRTEKEDEWESPA